MVFKMFNLDRVANIQYELLQMKESNRINLSDRDMVLICQYFDSVADIGIINESQINQLLKKLPQNLKSITNKPLGGIYGRYHNNEISMNANMIPNGNYSIDSPEYNQYKMYFFHELTDNYLWAGGRLGLSHV